MRLEREYGYESLAANIVIEAAKDYRKALKKLKKDPDNEHDSEAIRVELPGLGQIGHVANSPCTVIGESISAGRLYDKIGDTAEAEILYVLPVGVLCVVAEESLTR